MVAGNRRGAECAYIHACIGALYAIRTSRKRKTVSSAHGSKSEIKLCVRAHGYE